ncbi:RNA-binding protein [Vagococcus coleopterorum]|uniref:RNA-binding protein n=1 Tax=Vagococcus coleopterorum TaxID=2714946 RepID=A0A6G8APE1_9ENTE|nr:RNA-binding protein [Vagococcus coleopterorum]QIL46948.1 RNA-binding protein [Vagococcus coleopterorum]
MNVNVFQHFRKDEHPFVELTNDWIVKAAEQYMPVLTDYLDPRQAFIVKSLVGTHQDLKVEFDGGFEKAERVRAVIYPDYHQVSESDFDLTLLEINYPEKFAELSHGKILGTLMGTGLKREYFGDIITDGSKWQFFIQTDKVNYVITQLDKVGRFPVSLTEVPLTNLVHFKEEWSEEQLTVSSLRLDTVIASVFKISRQRAKVLVEGNKVKVNWAETTKLDFMLEDLDVISIRGFGRIQVRRILGRTKKDKLRLEIGVLRK